MKDAGGRVRPRRNSLDEMVLWDSFGTMLSSGVPILKTLNALTEAFPAYGMELKCAYDELKKGESLIGALEKYPNSFHPIVYPLIDAGEQSGALPEVLYKGADLIRKELDYGIDSHHGIVSKDLSRLVFFNYLATEVDAGLPLLRSLTVASKSPGLKRMQPILTKMCDGISKGKTFSEVIADGNDYFTKIDSEIIHAGELGGVLEVVLRKLADREERRYFAKRRR